jgi:probable phosphoglycerate mutase
MSEAVAYIDGGSHGNPGPAGIGVIIEHASQRVEISEPIGPRDNNYAEYAALLAALRYAMNNGCTRLRVFSDSEVVVRQINGHYSCQSPLLRHIYQLCLSLIGGFEAFTLTHIRREHNHEADELARLAIHRAKKHRGTRPVMAEAFGD